MLHSLSQPFVFHYTPLALPYVLAGLVVLVSAALVLRAEHGSRASALLMAYSACFAPWCLLRALRVSLLDAEQIIALTRLCYGLVCFSLPVIYWFICIVLQRESARLRSIRLNFAVAGVLSLLATGTPWLVDGWHQRPWGIEGSFGPLGWGLAGWIAALIVVSARDIQRARRATLPGSEARRRMNLLALASLALYAEASDLMTNWPGIPRPLLWLSLPMGFVSLPLFTGLTAILTRRYWLTEVNAPLAAQQIANLFNGVVLVLDDTGVIRYANKHCLPVLGLTPERLHGRDSGEALGAAFSPARLKALAEGSGREAHCELEWPHALSGAPHALQVSAMAVRDHRQRAVALVCMASDITEQKLQQQGLHDALTGLPQRRPFLSQLDGAVQQGAAFAVCFLGIARMRVINEDLGYAAGDRVLVETAQRIRSVLRPQDTVARLGGDEFGVLLGSPLLPPEARRLVQRLHTAVQAPIARADHPLYLSVSMGVAEGSASDTGAALLRTAGIGMQRAKQHGNRVEWMSGEQGSSSRTRLEAELRRALAQGEFQPFYQPVVDLEARRISGFEALVRWQHPDRGTVLPGEFIELAAETGLIADMDSHLLMQACRDLKHLQQVSGNPQLSVSVNLDAALLAQPTLVASVQKALDAALLPPECLRIEVLERLMLEPGVQSVLLALRALGVGLYIDDFGTGYSSLSRLHELPVTALKIDRSFVRSMVAGQGGETVVRNIIGLASNLRLEVVAEGVGSPEELAAVMAAGCRQVQGFHFSPAVSLEAAEALLQLPLEGLPLVL